MSKGTIRMHPSAITGGRIGTARIREQIASAARELADSTPAALGKPIRTLLSGNMLASCASPIARMQELGRLPSGTMNKTEAAYAQLLDARLSAGEILWYRFEGIKLRLADRTFITIDFAVIPAGAPLEFHEVKGRWTDDARAKTKIAAAQFPFRFIAIQRDGRHGWRTEDLTSRSW
ncbi:hypothetical protein ACLKMY_00555 [Paraburkholderia mimosarum]|uniref:hypothetical protein n=1 Tax=Paraburkholderia mimosarum TaxID=312026 RepID=UPI0039C3BE4D